MHLREKKKVMLRFEKDTNCQSNSTHSCQYVRLNYLVKEFSPQELKFLHPKLLVINRIAAKYRQ